MSERAAAYETIARGYRELLNALPPGEHDGVTDTPERAAKALGEMLTGYEVEVSRLFTVFPAEGYDQMISVTGIPFVSLCEHHLLPITGHAHVVYLPGEKIVGLSKIPRVVEAYSRRLQVQERLTAQIADALDLNLQPRGVMVVVEANHACMNLRGVRSNGLMQTSALRGVLYEAEARAEAQWLIGRSSK